MPQAPYVLTVNGGSSSIKLALFSVAQPLQRLLHGGIDGIGSPHAVFSMTGDDPADCFTRSLNLSDHRGAVGVVIDWLAQRAVALRAIGHRVVHGGPHYHQPQRIDPAMLAALRQMQAFDPEHLPGELLLVEAFQQRYPALPQVACFDTAFHHDLPRVAQQLAIPRRYQAQGVRRYGFHGLSYAFLLGELARVAGAAAAQGRVVLAHLGSGASLAAVLHGKSIDTSMGFTPTAGIPMSCRSGDVDPGVLSYLSRAEHLTAAQCERMVNHQSGLLGLSEISGDMQVLLACETQDTRAAEAIAVFCYQVKKYIGAYAAALEGLDSLVFAGGIGEHASSVRARICAGLEFLGIVIDPIRNAAHAAVISAAESRVTVRVMHTNEELVIAQAVCRTLDLS